MGGHIPAAVFSSTLMALDECPAVQKSVRSRRAKLRGGANAVPENKSGEIDYVQAVGEVQHIELEPHRAVVAAPQVHSQRGIQGK